MKNVPDFDKVRASISADYSADKTYEHIWVVPPVVAQLLS